MKSELNISLGNVKNEYAKMNNLSQLTMISFISKQEDLRNKFDSVANDLLMNAKDKSYSNKKKVTISQEALIVPHIIWDTVKPLFSHGYKKANVMHMVYKNMEIYGGISLKDITNACKKSIGCKNVCKAYAISKDDKLMKLFKYTVSKMLEDAE